MNVKKEKGMYCLKTISLATHVLFSFSCWNWEIGRLEMMKRDED